MKRPDHRTEQVQEDYRTLNRSPEGKRETHNKGTINLASMRTCDSVMKRRRLWGDPEY